MADHTLYITGAGVSAESGIPTFRGRDRFWTFGSLPKYPGAHFHGRFMIGRQPFLPSVNHEEAIHLARPAHEHRERQLRVLGRAI